MANQKLPTETHRLLKSSKNWLTVPQALKRGIKKSATKLRRLNSKALCKF